VGSTEEGDATAAQLRDEQAAVQRALTDSDRHGLLTARWTCCSYWLWCGYHCTALQRCCYCCCCHCSRGRNKDYL